MIISHWFSLFDENIQFSIYIFYEWDEVIVVRLNHSMVFYARMV